MIFSIFMILFFILNKNFRSDFFFLRDTFVVLNIESLLGSIGKTFLLISSLKDIMLLIHFTKNTPTILTKIGKHSLSVYFFHLFFVYPLRHKEYFSPFSDTATLLILAVYTFAISFLLSRDIVYNTLQYMLRR